MRIVWKDFTQKLGLDADVMRQRCYCVYGESLVLVEGQKSVLSVGTAEISFAYGGGTLKIRGENLKIRSLSSGFAAVEGKIISVDRL